MTEKKGYLVAHLHVTDPDGYRVFLEEADVAFAAHGAKFLVRGGLFNELEGAEGLERHVVVEFPSYQTAMDCYESETFQAANQHRLTTSTGAIIVVEGV